jgi:hypothetical protein
LHQICRGGLDIGLQFLLRSARDLPELLAEMLDLALVILELALVILRDRRALGGCARSRLRSELAKRGH